MRHRFVDVWQADLNQYARCLSKLTAVLNEQEKQRADTFQQPLLRNRYIAVRAITRHVLANYLSAQPADLQFSLGEYGKPDLISDSLYFNISHTDHLLLIAVGNLPDIGVDIELIKTRSNMDGMAKRCFAESEFQFWQPLPEPQSQETFYRLWTKKEAFVKAIGRGIALGLNRCEIESQKDGQIISIPEDYGLACDWKITEIPVIANFCAALVTPNLEFELRQRLFDSNQLEKFTKKD
jgi:4'-phosphopantetheinyl transferase